MYWDLKQVTFRLCWAVRVLGNAASTIKSPNKENIFVVLYRCCRQFSCTRVRMVAWHTAKSAGWSLIALLEDHNLGGWVGEAAGCADGE
jgi:hypothetical protein